MNGTVLGTSSNRWRDKNSLRYKSNSTQATLQSTTEFKTQPRMVAELLILQGQHHQEDSRVSQKQKQLWTRTRHPIQWRGNGFEAKERHECCQAPIDAESLVLSDSQSDPQIEQRLGLH